MKSLKSLKNIHYFITTVKDGNLDFRFDNKLKVFNNRKIFFNRIGLDAKNSVCMNVINHSDNILIVTEKYLGKGIFDLKSAPKVDALITNKREICLMLLTADCIPVSLYDPIKKVISLIHLSRRTIYLNLAKKVVRCLMENFDTNPRDIVINFGPHIHKKSYILDLSFESLKQFIELGTLKENIKISPINTYTNLNYFSHRRSQDQKIKEGRFATILEISKVKL